MNAKKLFPSLAIAWLSLSYSFAASTTFKPSATGLTVEKLCATFSAPDNNKNEKMLSDFALDPLTRSESEKMLSLLISGKSPMITSWVKKRGIDPVKSPELVALEWDKYYAKNFILGRYPVENPKLNQKIEELFAQLIKKNLDGKTQKRYETLFSKAKEEAKSLINSFAFSPEDKRLLVAKIEGIKLYWPVDLKNSKYAKTPLEFVDWSLAYDPSHNEINVGLNALRLNDHNLLSVLLHEIAHSFDSCRWSVEFPKAAWPFERIEKCLRSMARTRDDSQLENFYQKGKLSEGDFQKLKNNPTCNNSIYPPIGLQADQLPETFADWFSAEATPLEIMDEKFRNDLCQDQEVNEGSSYLSNRDRLAKIFLASKRVQEQLKVVAPVEACHF